MLYDPRPLDDPSYWDNSEELYEIFCESMSEKLEEEFKIKISAQDLKNNFFAEYYFDTGFEFYEAADAYARDFYSGDEWIMRKLTTEQAKAEYKEFVDDFDPSPIYYGDDYAYLPSFEDWLDEEDIEIVWKPIAFASKPTMVAELSGMKSQKPEKPATTLPTESTIVSVV